MTLVKKPKVESSLAKAMSAPAKGKGRATPVPNQSVITFKEWLVLNADLVDQEFQRNNGHEECPECNGTGYVEWEDQEDSHFMASMQDLYNEQVQKDQTKLQEWTRIMQEEQRAMEGS